MHCIITKRLLFREGVKELHVLPSQKPQRVPEWIKETKLFRLAVADGSITEVVPQRTQRARPEPGPVAEGLDPAALSAQSEGGDEGEGEPENPPENEQPKKPRKSRKPKAK